MVDGQVAPMASNGRVGVGIDSFMMGWAESPESPNLSASLNSG